MGRSIMISNKETVISSLSPSQEKYMSKTDTVAPFSWIFTLKVHFGRIVQFNHKVSTTGDGTRKQGDVEISNFPISLWDGLVIDVSFVCEFKGSSHAPVG